MVDVEDIINLYFKAGCEFKEVARRSVDKINHYLEAADKFGLAAKISLAFQSDDIDVQAQNKVFSEYYLYEENTCLSAFYYEKRETKKAAHYQSICEEHLDNALAAIKNMQPDVSPGTRKHLNTFLNRWSHFREVEKYHRLSISAREAFDDGHYAEALDFYHQSVEQQNEIIESIDDKNISPVYKRIAKANALGAKSNTYGAMALIIAARGLASGGAFNEGEFFNMLRFEKDAYVFGKQAFECNPEWQQYNIIAQGHLRNIKNALESNPDSWAKIIIEFEDDDYFLKIMRQTDPEKFQAARAAHSPQKQEINFVMNNPTFNNIDIDNSQIGMLNTGSIKDVEQIDINVSTLIEAGQKEVAEALKRFSEAVVASEDLSEDDRGELIEQVKLISDQASLPAEKRTTGIIKPVLSGIVTTISAAGGLSKLWESYGDMICSYLGVENPLKK